MEIRQALKMAADQFNEVGINSAMLDSRVLLAHIFGKSPEFILMNFDQPLKPDQFTKFRSLVERRLQFEPMAYITGVKEFYSRDFLVDKNVLIPRPDTETLIDVVLQNYNSSDEIKILDLGVGSGNISITLALELPLSTIVAVDNSAGALSVAERNAVKHKVADRIHFIKSDWFANISEQKFDLIISNPPYVSVDEKELMARETIKFEPHSALFANDFGLAEYKIILSKAKDYLNNNGVVCFELGFNQLTAFEKVLKDYCYKIVSVSKDFQGFDRVIFINNTK